MLSGPKQSSFSLSLSPVAAIRSPPILLKTQNCLGAASGCPNHLQVQVVPITDATDALSAEVKGLGRPWPTVSWLRAGLAEDLASWRVSGPASLAGGSVFDLHSVFNKLFLCAWNWSKVLAQLAFRQIWGVSAACAPPARLLMRFQEPRPAEINGNN